MLSIHPLSPELIRLIAAGEVIDSLVAVVRELVDNSLDAGATRISVCIWPQRWTLQVSDDGRGMPSEDALVCALPHQTSKIQSVEDLWQVNTLGFRGEGLYALATVGELTLVTRPKKSLASWQRYGPQGQVIEQKPQGAALGTIVTLSDIFGQMPVRRQFLNLQKEVDAILQWIKYRALAHPHVTWQVSIGEDNSISTLKPKLSLWPGRTATDILLQLFPRLEPSDFAEGSTSTLTEEITVTVGLPNRYSRPRPDWMIFTVNGRCVEDKALLEGVSQVFRRTLPKGRYPLCVVNLELPAERLNWNVHPAKTAVLCQDQPALIKQIQDTLAQVLADTLPSQDSRLFRAAMKRTLKEEGASYETGNTGRKLKALAQIRNTYVLAEHPEGLWLVEQHVAEERVLFELIQREWKLVDLPNVALVEDLTQRQQDNLEALGMVLEPFGENVWAIRQAPVCLLERSDGAEALRELSRCSDLDGACASLACRTAIRNGTPLDLSYMQNLLDRWSNTQNPHTCPHGRPIYLPLAENDLARFFRRNWTLCDNSPQALRKRAGLSDSFPSEP
jgi:DNA mismatch repair protein MutL